ncbi:MAG TPA: SDR family oxidoreductase [Steroidobacteraceae bacterium]|jgi:NAD(P)-dependent dehydrogenase (short-subunit alcohol dehydrogenase family)|nr:SDR family oxidoreductase [Steroidobacteraceae bacterium]
MKLFKDRVALVTGGASGIGLGLVQNFLKLDMKCVIVDFNAAYLDELRDTLRARADVHLVQADVGDRDQVRAAAQEAIRMFGRIHVLCNNAGIGGGGDTHDADFDAWDKALRVNLGGVVNCTKIIAPLIIGHGEGGHIVNTSSMAGLVPLPLVGLGAYQTAKFAVRGFTESLRMSMAPHGIGVSCLFPGGTRTRIIEAGAPNEAARAAAREMTASWMDPEELGARVVEGIRHNAPYILTHMEFRDEVRELHAMLDAAFPQDQDVPPGRGGFEERRRALVAASRTLPVKD